MYRLASTDITVDKLAWAWGEAACRILDQGKVAAIDCLDNHYLGPRGTLHHLCFPSCLGSSTISTTTNSALILTK